MRKLLIAALVLGIAAVPAYGAKRTVKIGDDYFVKRGGATVTVQKGTKVVWRNTGDNPHDVKVTKGPKKFRSDTLFEGDTFKKRMKKAGTYRIVCTIHRGEKSRPRFTRAGRPACG